MSLLLNIDTATEHASVCISRDGIVLAIVESTEQKNHAAFVQPAIEKMANDARIVLNDIDAVAVTAGPGSYTGLRVGLASAKGIAYALQKPLILINTLEVMAAAVIKNMSRPLNDSTLICPMIDARRMEVFTGLYNIFLQEIKPPYPLILDPTSFDEILQKQPVVFSGSGSAKLKNLLVQKTAYFSDTQHNATDLAARAIIAWNENRFADIAYSEPLYVKEFFSAVPPKSK